MLRMCTLRCKVGTLYHKLIPSVSGAVLFFVLWLLAVTLLRMYVSAYIGVLRWWCY